jgi:hypothetical protein
MEVAAACAASGTGKFVEAGPSDRPRGAALPDSAMQRAPYMAPSPTAAKLPCNLKSYGHFTTGGIDDKIDSTLPPVFRPNTVPRS